MGVDKAELRLGGRTLLEIAVAKLDGLCSEVVVVGDRRSVPGGLRVLGDLRPGCGPIGGMAAALKDVGRGRAAFLPVDMPLLPSGLLAGLLGDWKRAGSGVCFAAVDGQAQPLVSLVAGDCWEEFAGAIERGEYKVRPLLEACGRKRAGLRQSEISTALGEGAVWPGWLPDANEWREREMWFANLNTPEEFAAAERVLRPRSDAGSTL